MTLDPHDQALVSCEDIGDFPQTVRALPCKLAPADREAQLGLGQSDQAPPLGRTCPETGEVILKPVRSVRLGLLGGLGRCFGLGTRPGYTLEMRRKRRLELFLLLPQPGNVLLQPMDFGPSLGQSRVHGYPLRVRIDFDAR